MGSDWLHPIGEFFLDHVLGEELREGVAFRTVLNGFEVSARKCEIVGRSDRHDIISEFRVSYTRRLVGQSCSLTRECTTAPRVSLRNLSRCRGRGDTRRDFRSARRAPPTPLAAGSFCYWSSAATSIRSARNASALKRFASRSEGPRKSPTAVPLSRLRNRRIPLS